LRAPGKLNWTLEALAKRPDGYHEVRTILQTIDLSDWVTLTHSDGLTLELRGEAGSLAGEATETNLAYRAAALLQEWLSAAHGARIELEKHVPVGAGLGGGSSDAAAVLRGLRALWRIDIADEELASLASELGSDVPFFLRGGAALASGRGEQLSSLPDEPTQRLVIAWPRRPAPPDKTARMYGALRPEHYRDGSYTERLAARFRTGAPPTNDDLSNVFEDLLAVVDAAAAQTFEEAKALGVGSPHLAGSGPAVFFLLASDDPAGPLLRALERLGLQAVETRTLPSAGALACEELG
jgi:4-diphosphocytidyl-2-C-methyl-D-erythritol kinase